jgi:hypothetical protein
MKHTKIPHTLAEKLKLDIHSAILYNWVMFKNSRWRQLRKLEKKGIKWRG